MGDQEKPIWEGELHGKRMRLATDLSIWRAHEGDIRKWMEVDGEWFKVQPPGAHQSVFEVALCKVAAERDKLHAENETLRARLAKLEALPVELDAIERESDNESASLRADNDRTFYLRGYADGVGRATEELRALLHNSTKGSGDGQTEAK